MPLVTKQEHLDGQKTVTLCTRWGEEIKITIKALGWREIKEIAKRASESKEDYADLIVRASLGDAQEKQLDYLDVRSVGELQRVCLAFALGEKADSKNGEAPGQTSPAASGLPSGREKASLSPQGGPMISFPDGAPQDSPSRLSSLSDPAPCETSGHSPLPALATLEANPQ
jgi:hypothetical protein